MTLGLPLGGLGLGFAALALWVSALPWRSLDGLALALFVGGLSLSAAGYARVRPSLGRRLAVIGIGLNGFGLAALLILYGAG